VLDPDRSTDDLLLQSLLRIEALLESLPERLVAEMRGEPREQDRAVLQALVPAFEAGLLRDLFFTTAELIKLLRERSPATLGQLQDLLGGGETGRRLGRLLSRMEGETVDGWRFERRGVEHGVTLWRVVSKANKPRKPPSAVANESDSIHACDHGSTSHRYGNLVAQNKR
jgi:hypothetical protein